MESKSTGFLIQNHQNHDFEILCNQHWKHLQNAFGMNENAPVTLENSLHEDFAN